MDKSATYAACEQLIEMPFMRMQLSKLDEMLERLEQNGRLTYKEHQGLLELATRIWRVNSSVIPFEFSRQAIPIAQSSQKWRSR
jgi:DNA-binding IclR family transcriptional regulator